MLSCKGDKEKSIMSACFPKTSRPTGSWTAADQLCDDLLAKALNVHNPKDNVTRSVAKKRIGGALSQQLDFQ